MRFRTVLVPVAAAALTVAGCDDGKPASDTTAKTAKADKTDAPGKAEPKPPPETKSDPEPDAGDTAAEPVPDEPEPKPEIVVQTPEDIPVALGGAVAPYEPPATPPPPAPAPAAPPAADAAAAAPAAKSVGALAAPSAAAAVAEPPSTGVKIAHNHPPGETCKPLARADVEKALADLRK